MDTLFIYWFIFFASGRRCVGRAETGRRTTGPDASRHYMRHYSMLK